MDMGDCKKDVNTWQTVALQEQIVVAEYRRRAHVCSE